MRAGAERGDLGALGAGTHAAHRRARGEDALVTNGETMKKRSIQLGTWIATAIIANALGGCGSQAGGGTGNDSGEPSTVTEAALPSSLDPARSVSAAAATEPDAFVNTPDDGHGRPVSDELRAQLEVELNAHPVEKLDQKTLKAGVAFSVGFANDTEVNGQVIASANTHICYLVAQAFRMRDPEDPEFFLKVDENANIVAYKAPGPMAQVRCVPRDFFTASLGAKPHQNDYNYYFTWDKCGAFQASSGYQGNVVEMLTGIGYDYAGSSDNFRIIQANSSNQMNQLRIEQRNGACRGVGFTAPVAFNKATVTFEGPNGVGTASFAGEYVYSASPGASLDQQLTHGGTGVSALDSECYFTYLGGSFSGPADLAFLRIQNNNWYLSLLGTSGGTQARVRCVRHNQ